MKSKADKSFYVPDGMDREPALSRTTHLGLGAHPDDLEFMALHGILRCYYSDDHWFGGVICTNGAGSARAGRYADVSDEEMVGIRWKEQKVAARIGQFSFVEQLGQPSAVARDPGKRPKLVQGILQILQRTHPDIVYTHNPFDKHPTHIGVMLAGLEAMRLMPASERPKTVLGCEVWRSLDWLPEAVKIAQPVGSHPELATELTKVFHSQIAGGKRYDLAVEGRRRANATFSDAHTLDEQDQLAFAIDLTALIRDNGPPVDGFMKDVLERFRADCLGLVDSIQ